MEAGKMGYRKDEALSQTPQAFYKKLDQEFLNSKANMVML